MNQHLPSRKLLTGILLLMVAVFLFVLYRTAWLSDDAYITYRSVENLVTGYGMTFNPGQRVQAYTHPLWAFVHIPLRLVFSNMYYIGLFVSICTTIAATSLMVCFATKQTEIRIFLLAALVSSAAVMDYSTSGLENPLTHVLLAGFTILNLSDKQPPRYLLLLSLGAGLLLLNRMDSILLVAPMLFLAWWKKKSLPATLTVLLGLSPFLLWEVIALLYYGFPFPMTAYAKLNTSIERRELIVQGFHYVEDLVRHDPLTFLVILAGITTPLLLKNRRLYPVSLGIILYLTYTVYIGGDFMRGRFFTAPFFLSLILLAQLLPLKIARFTAPILIVLGLLGTSPPIFSHPELGNGKFDTHVSSDHGIADERAYYFSGSGLIAHTSGQKPDLKWVDQGKKVRKAFGKYFLSGNMGFVGYYAGPDKHLIDRYALTDPFLAHLPNVYLPDWRPGHNQRLIPRGYIESLETGENQLVSPQLQEVYAAIQRITQAPIWDTERLQTIWEINATRKYADLIDRSLFTMPIVAQFSEENLDQVNSQTLLSHSDAGFSIRLKSARRIASVRLWLQGDCEYTCVFKKGTKIVQGRILTKSESPSQELRRFTISGPNTIVDNVVIYPNTATHPCKIRDISILE